MIFLRDNLSKLAIKRKSPPDVFPLFLKSEQSLSINNLLNMFNYTMDALFNPCLTNECIFTTDLMA